MKKDDREALEAINAALKLGAPIILPEGTMILYRVTTIVIGNSIVEYKRGVVHAHESNTPHYWINACKDRTDCLIYSVGPIPQENIVKLLYVPEVQKWHSFPRWA